MLSLYYLDEFAQPYCCKICSHDATFPFLMCYTNVAYVDNMKISILKGNDYRCILRLSLQLNDSTSLILQKMSKEI